MAEYYCRVDTGGQRLWGYQEARTRDLALECFIQDQNLKEEDISFSFSDRVDMVMVSRLKGFIPQTCDPWGCDPEFSLDLVSKVKESDIRDLEEDVSHDELMCNVTNANWHAARILWMVKNPESLRDPISMDNLVSGGRILCVPKILDGWHRYFAHIHLRKRKIPVLYGGRVDLKRFLTGLRKTPPLE
jgi:hypothetical protein